MSAVCGDCDAGDHLACRGSVPTGRLVPDDDPYRERTRMLEEHAACDCPCRTPAGPDLGGEG